MAATNYTPIQLYYSTTASAAPTSGNLTSGELAINITDGKLYYKDNGGVVQVIATKGAGTIGGTTTQIQYNNAGALAGNAAMTFNSGTSTTTLTTLNLTNALGAIYGGTSQSAYTQGDILYSSATNTLSKLGIGAVNYILTSTGSVPQWVAPTSITVNTATNLAGGTGGSVPYQSAADTTTFLAIGAANRVMTSSGTAPQWVTSLTGLTGLSTSSFTNTSLTSGRVRYSTTGGLETDSASLTFNGTTLSAGGFSTTGLSTLVQTVKIGDSNFNGVAVFAPSTPAKLYIGTGTVTDTTSAIGATNATGAVSSLAITPIAATNTSVTYTNASTLYIAGAPSAGTNVTITNPYSLYIAAGASYLGGDLTLNGGTANGVTYLNGSKVLTSGSALTFDGSNLGLGVTPSAWSSSFKAYQVGNQSLWSTAAGNGYLTNNAFFNTSNSYIYRNNGFATEYIQSIVNGSHSWFTAPSGTAGNAISFTQAMTLDASGNLGIGTSSPSSKLTVAGTTEIVTGTTATVITSNNSVDTGFVLRYTSGLTLLGNNFTRPLAFLTDNLERARIDTSGNWLVGTTSVFGSGVSVRQNGAIYADSPNSNSSFVQRETSGGGSCIDFFRPITTNNATFAYFGTEDSFTTRGTIFYNRTTGLVNYTTTSDKRLKTNIQNAPSATDLVGALQVRQFDWKDSGNHLEFGFVAQELYEVAPFAVSAGTTDEEDIGKAPWSVDNSTLVPMLVKAIQEQQAIITALTARVAALEAA